MSTDAPYFGIDFGTTYSSMAWYDANKAEAKIILNDHDEAKTPSLVFFGEDDEILIGNDAANKIEEYENSDDPQERDYVSQRLVRSIKRRLINPPLIPIPGYGDVRPVEVVALILGKLKQDAEQNHFDEEIERVVLTCPAISNRKEREVLREAAKMAGFKEVELLEEPTAAAVAVHEQGLRIGKGVLIYDLGAGTFDLSVVVREEDGSFYVPMESQGNPMLGGDDFDQALYDHCEGIAREKLGRPISLSGKVDLSFLKQCRARKENLSRAGKSRFGSYLPSKNGPQWFGHEVDRETFEGLIRGRVEGTVRQTVRLYEQAESRGHEVETVVLIGGSSQVPLVGRMLGKKLPKEPRNFAGRTHAVALGAAYHAYELWKIPGGKEDHRVEVPEEEGWVPGKEEDSSEVFAEFSERFTEVTVGKWLKEEGDQVKAGEAIVELETEIVVFEVEAEQDGVLQNIAVGEGEDVEIGDVIARIRPTIPTEQKKDSRVEDSDKGGRGSPGRTWKGTATLPVKLLRTLTGHSGEVNSVAYSPDGSLLASGSHDGTAKLWDPQSGENLWTLRAHTDWVRSVAYSPDGSLLASGSFDKTVKLWDPWSRKWWNPRGGKLLRTLRAHSDRVWSVAYSPDGGLLASGSGGPSGDHTVKLWDPQSGNLLRTLISARSGSVTEVAFSPDGCLMASGSSDKTVKLWDPQSAELLQTLGHPGWVTSVAFSPGGSLLASSILSDGVKLWGRDGGR